MIITRTPFRISYVGGGTDFKDFYENYGGGSVISTTINKFIYVTVNHKFDNKIHLRYSQTEAVDDVNDLKHDIVREALKMTGIYKGIEIVIISDVPTQGSGLGSSSSLSIGLLNALNAYNGRYLGKKELALKACQLEIENLKSPIGYQDQFAASYGGFNLIYFDKSGILVSNLDRTFGPKRKKQIQDSTLLFYLNKRLSNDILVQHQKDIKCKYDILQAQKELVAPFIAKIPKEENSYALGSLVSASWNLKKAMTPEASNEKIDELINLAISAGAYGAKLCGAGGGGFLMVICENGKKGNVRKVLRDYLEMKFSFETEGSQIIYEE